VSSLEQSFCEGTRAPPELPVHSAASHRLKREDGRFGLIAACADGGIGHACIIERFD